MNSHRRRSSVCRQTELRHVDVQHTKMLGQILDVLDSWQRLMLHIPRAQRNGSEFESADRLGFKYTHDDVRKIKEASLQSNEYNAGQLLLDEWGTSGRVRPNLGHLMQLLVQLQLYRAADFLASQVLMETPPPRPSVGIAARVDIRLRLKPAAAGQTISPNLNRSTLTKTSPSNVQKINDHISDFIKFSQTRQPELTEAHAVDFPLNIPSITMLQPALRTASHRHDAGSISSANLVLPDFSALQPESYNIPNVSALQRQPNCVPDLSELRQQDEKHASVVIPNLTEFQKSSAADSSDDQQRKISMLQRSFSTIKTDDDDVKLNEMPLLSALQQSSTASTITSVEQQFVITESDIIVPAFSTIYNLPDLSGLIAEASMK